ncbi:MAG TPA: Uma2 family endonuclease [Kofleriaceae bacterium]|nr:Uma2 family endonuclease [Kofleriaceae bacterium]
MFDPQLVSPEKIRPLLRREYERMVELGMFEDERVELLRGVLVTMSPQGGPHATLSSWIFMKLTMLLGIEHFDIRAHCPYAATDDSEPEPDISVSRRRPGFHHPTEPLLVIEVSDSSIRKDTKLKASIYGEAGAPEYWIIDISKDELTVAVHTRPTPNGYGHVEILRDGDVLRPTKLPGVEFAVLDIPWNR